MDFSSISSQNKEHEVEQSLPTFKFTEGKKYKQTKMIKKVKGTVLWNHKVLIKYNSLIYFEEPA